MHDIGDTDFMRARQSVFKVFGEHLRSAEDRCIDDVDLHFGLPVVAVMALCHVELYVFEITNLIVDANFWRRNPTCILAWLITWLHQ